MKTTIEIVGKQMLFDKEVAIYGTLENPLFPIKEVGRWIGLKNPSIIASRLEKEEVTKFNLGSKKGDTLSSPKMVFMKSSCNLESQSPKNLRKASSAS